MIQGTLKAQTAYLQSLETSDMFAPTNDDSDENTAKKIGNKLKNKKDSQKKISHPAQNAEAKTLKESITALRELHGKMYGDLSFAKREIAWGKLRATDIDELFLLFRGIMVPLVGMSTITDIFERIAERRGWVQVPNSKFDKSEAWERCDSSTKYA